jgi:hypothetical protein
LEFRLNDGAAEPVFSYRLYERKDTGRVGEDGKRIVRETLVPKRQSLNELVKEFIEVYKKYVHHDWESEWQKKQFNKCLQASVLKDMHVVLSLSGMCVLTVYVKDMPGHGHVVHVKDTHVVFCCAYMLVCLRTCMLCCICQGHACACVC